MTARAPNRPVERENSLSVVPSSTPSSPAALIGILAVCGFASTFTGRCVEPLVAEIARDLASEPKTVALLSTAFALPYALIQPILGPIGDALGKAPIMRLCLAILTAALIASGFARTLPLLFALRVISGAAAGGVIPLALAMIGDRVGMETRQVAISRFVIAIILGQLAGSSLAGVIGAGIGWRGVLALSAALAAAACAMAVAGLSRRSSPRPFSLAGAASAYRAILGIPLARALFTFVFLEAIAIFGIFPYIAPLLESRGEGGAFEAGLVLGGFALGGLLYTALVGWMLRRLGLARMLAGGGVIGAAALVAVGIAGDWRLDAAALAALGLGFYMLHNSFQTQVTEVAPSARASAVALHAFSFFCGQALGVVLVGLGLQQIGQFATLALCAALIAAVGLTSGRVIGGRAGKGG